MYGVLKTQQPSGMRPGRRQPTARYRGAIKPVEQLLLFALRIPVRVPKLMRAAVLRIVMDGRPALVAGPARPS
jgi:hypothetical protein